MYGFSPFFTSGFILCPVMMFLFGPKVIAPPFGNVRTHEPVSLQLESPGFPQPPPLFHPQPPPHLIISH